MRDDAPAIAIQGLCARLPTGFGIRRRTILHDIQLELPAGQYLGLMGPNGSGKTTLMRHLAGLLRPSAGRVQLFGVDARDPRAFAAVTYLPEDSPFPKDLNARDALALLASLRGQRGPSARRAQTDALERAGLGERATTPLARYSRGMLRRFGLAQAFLFEPQLVLLDEPTAGLDAPGLQLLEDWLTEHRSRGGSLVLCSHSLGDHIRHTDRIAVLWEGRLALHGSTRESLAAEGRRWVEWTEGARSVSLDALQAWLQEAGAKESQAGPAWMSLSELYGTWSDPKGSPPVSARTEASSPNRSSSSSTSSSTSPGPPRP